VSSFPNRTQPLRHSSLLSPFSVSTFSAVKVSSVFFSVIRRRGHSMPAGASARNPFEASPSLLSWPLLVKFPRLSLCCAGHFFACALTVFPPRYPLALWSSPPEASCPRYHPSTQDVLKLTYLLRVSPYRSQPFRVCGFFAAAQESFTLSRFPRRPHCASFGVSLCFPHAVFPSRLTPSLKHIALRGSRIAHTPPLLPLQDAARSTVFFLFSQRRPFFLTHGTFSLTV